MQRRTVTRVVSSGSTGAMGRFTSARRRPALCSPLRAVLAIVLLAIVLLSWKMLTNGVRPAASPREQLVSRLPSRILRPTAIEQEVPPLRFQPAAEKFSVDAPPQLAVLGMHHSGTSIVTRLLMLMGAYGGDRADMVMLRNNPLKYWEYRDAVDADKALLKAGRPVKYGPWWVDYGFSWEHVSAPDRLTHRLAAERVVAKLDAGAGGSSPWVLKDPRLCLTADTWLGTMARPVCVIVTRPPLSVAHRMLGYNRRKGESLTLAEWAEVWENFMASAVAACLHHGAPIVHALYSDLERDPHELSLDLFAQLSALAGGGVDPDAPWGLRRLSEKEVSDELGSMEEWKAHHMGRDKELHANGANEAEVRSLLSERAVTIWKALESRPHERGELQIRLGAIVKVSPPPLRWSSVAAPPLPRKKAVLPQPPPLSRKSVRGARREAYATMVSSEDKGYLAGAVALAASIRALDASRDLVAMTTAEVTDPAVAATLEHAGWIVRSVPKLDEPWFRRHPKCNKFNAAQVIRWGRMFSKLQMWSLIEYDTIVYMDTDTILLRAVDDYFGLPGPFYAERSPTHKGINAGIIVMKPSAVTLDAMLSWARSNEPMEFFRTNQVGCTEQELFNRYFHGEMFGTKLNNTRHADYLSDRFTMPTGREEMRDHGARIVHWITTKCPKPWAIERALLHLQPKQIHRKLRKLCDPEMYRVWHNFFWDQDLQGTLLEAGLPDLPPGLLSAKI